jgi:hypothetical protein
LEAGNAAAGDGSLGSNVKGILDDLKAEAPCFIANEFGEA